MLQNMELTKGLLFSQRTMLLLVEKGLHREEAYKIVQENSMRTWDEDKDFRDLVKNDTRVNSLINEQEMKDLFSYDNYTKYVDKIFEKAGL